jgi:hypothetical protein
VGSGNIFTVVVTSPTAYVGNTITYTITIVRSSNPTLSSLSLSPSSMAPAFSPAVRAYTTTLLGNELAASITATSNAVSARATVGVSWALEIPAWVVEARGGGYDVPALPATGSVQVRSGVAYPVQVYAGSSQVVTVTLTGLDGLSTSTYRITVVRSIPPYLNYFALSPQVSILPAVWSPWNSVYDIVVSSQAAEVAISLQPATVPLTRNLLVKNMATGRVRSQDCTSWYASGVVPEMLLTLAPGMNQFVVFLFSATDGTREYTLNIKRTTNPFLTALSFSTGESYPAFVPGVLAGNPTYDLFFTVADTQVVTAMKKLRIVRLGFGTS